MAVTNKHLIGKAKTLLKDFLDTPEVREEVITHDIKGIEFTFNIQQECTLPCEWVTRIIRKNGERRVVTRCVCP